MSFVAVVTVRDDGAAQVLADALTDAGVPVEIKRLGASPYFGSVTVSEIEVRVPEERLEEAERAIARVAADGEEWARREAGVPPDALDDEPPPEPAPAPPVDPALSPRKLSWAIVISLLVPFPAGCLYARAFSVGWILIGVYLTGWIATFGGMHNGVSIVLFAKGADLVLAPLYVLSWNRRRTRPPEENIDAARS